jgi:glycerol transport system ATP-binding protein
MLTLEGLSKTVGHEDHLVNIDLTLQPGTINVLLGHTGAGKTSLLRIIAGLDKPSRGTLRYDGVDLVATPARRRSVALVYQQFINYPSLTVRSNIASPLRLRRAPNTDARVLELARLLRIEELLDRLPGELSGGQQQRVAIARALAKGAEVLLLDEPLVNLDYKLREGLRDELRMLFGSAQSGVKPTTVVYATTDPSEALALGGTTILIDRGRILQHASTLEVYHRPASVTVARVFGDPPMNLVDGEVRDHEIQLSGELRLSSSTSLHLASLPDGRYRFGIRASDCRLYAPEGGIAVRARVELSEISGSETFVYLRAVADSTQFIVQQDGVFHYHLDQELTFYLDPKRLLAFSRDDNQTLLTSYHPGP